MFSYYRNNTKDINFGVSGGFGFDLEDSFSVFLGPSINYNQNITFTLGISAFNQKLLSSQYQEGDTINENLNFDQLHEDFIRLGFFFGLSFRLDRSPF